MKPLSPKHDPAHAATQDLINKAFMKSYFAYDRAQDDINEKINAYLQRFAAKDAEMQKKLAAGEIKKKDYNAWRAGQMMAGKRWEAMRKTIATDLVNTGKIAKSAILGHMPQAYAINHNYATYLVEHGGLVDTSYVLYDRQTVERLIEKDPQILPPPGKKTLKDISEGKLIAWQEGQVQSVTLQSILQGESIPNMAKRISKELSNRGKNDCIRYARTAMTEAQNAGREDAYKRAANMGIKMKEAWIATLDGGTRHEHRQLDGQEKDVGGFFTVDGYKIRYPGDPTAEAFLVYNCRCTTIAQIEGFERDVKGFSLRNDPALGGMSYEEWKAEKEKETPYTIAKHKYEDVSEKVQNASGIDTVLSGIWYNKDVTYKDWEDVKGSIPAKEKYYQDQIAQLQADGSPAALAKAQQMQDHLDELQEYQAHGQTYYDLLQEQDLAKKEMEALMPQLTPAMQQAMGPFDADAYSQARKDAAVWAKSPKEADKHLRQRTGEVWQNATKEEKDAICDYTSSYHKFNEPLRGEEYGTNQYKGVGNTDLDAGRAHNGSHLNAMTDIIGKCTYDEDVWLQRGVGYRGMDNFFGIDMRTLQNGSQKVLEDQLLGKEITEYGFMSCGSSKGKGFSGNILLNVYCPKGTKMMYVEPFSSFGNGDGRRWDGKSGQSSFGSELETILQQGTKFKIAKIERTRGQLYFDLEVIDQSTQQRWKP